MFKLRAQKFLRLVDEATSEALSPLDDSAIIDS